MGVVDILSIDINGNDYWVLKELSLEGISIIVVEYNPIFGDIASCTVPRNDIFNRTSEHSSNLYWGASLTAFIELLAIKKFTFVGTNRVGNNAFFCKFEFMSRIRNFHSRWKKSWKICRLPNTRRKNYRRWIELVV
jgi:hypothetical protein